MQPAFKNAKVWSNEAHWNWATEPNPREKASFLTENILPIQQNGQLNFIQQNAKDQIGFDVFIDGRAYRKTNVAKNHISRQKPSFFMADLLPTVGHIPLPYVMGL